MSKRNIKNLNRISITTGHNLGKLGWHNNQSSLNTSLILSCLRFPRLLYN